MSLQSNGDATDLGPADQQWMEEILTAIAIANYAIQDSNEISSHTIHFIESSKDCDDVGTRIGVLLSQDAR